MSDSLTSGCDFRQYRKDRKLATRPLYRRDNMPIQALEFDWPCIQVKTGKEGQYADTLKGKIVLADKVGTAANYCCHR